MPDNKMVTVINGLGEKFSLPKAKLEQYKKQMAEFMTLHQEVTGECSPLYEIKEIIEE